MYKLRYTREIFSEETEILTSIFIIGYVTDSKMHIPGRAV